MDGGLVGGSSRKLLGWEIYPPRNIDAVEFFFDAAHFPKLVVWQAFTLILV